MFQAFFKFKCIVGVIAEHTSSRFLAPLLLLELLSYWHALNGHSSVPISGNARV